jgi:cell division protein ZapA
MESPGKIVHVNIYGEEYAIRSENEEAYIRQVAEYVDRAMRDLAEKVPNKSPSRVAVLTALNIADELFAERNSGQSELSVVEKRTHEMISLLDEKLPRVSE